MAGTRRFPLFIFTLLTAVNAVLFLYKSHFEYKPYASEQELYAPANGIWRQYLSDFPSASQQATTWFLDSLFKGNDTAQLAQVNQIGSFLYRQFNDRLGKPVPDQEPRSPWEMYNFFKSDSSRKLWCGHLAMMFNYFCLARGIESRMIEIMKPGDHHVVNECYVGALQKWVLVDITYNQLQVKAGSGSPMSLVDFRGMQGTATTLLVHTANDSGRVIRPDSGYIKNYYNSQYPAYYYLTVNPQQVYKTTEKVKRYVWPVSWYRILAAGQKSNFLFYVKQGLLIAWLLSLLVLFRSLVKKRRPVHLYRG